MKKSISQYDTKNHSLQLSRKTKPRIFRKRSLAVTYEKLHFFKKFCVKLNFLILLRIYQQVVYCAIFMLFHPLIFSFTKLAVLFFREKHKYKHENLHEKKIVCHAVPSMKKVLIVLFFFSIFNPWICKKLYDKHFHRSELYSKLLFFNPGKLFTQICVHLQVPGESKILQRA